MQGVAGLFNFGDIYNPRYGETAQRPNPLPKTTDPMDWECPNEKCKNINFKKRDTCNRCGIKRPKDWQPDPRVAKQIAQKEAEGIIGADNKWLCPSCGESNHKAFARCENCNAPKITQERIKSKMEHQGRAGGYYDRQDVDRNEYNSDEESVDEYGRKKKKKGALGAVKRGPAPFRTKRGTAVGDKQDADLAPGDIRSSSNDSIAMGDVLENVVAGNNAIASQVGQPAVAFTCCTSSSSTASAPVLSPGMTTAALAPNPTPIATSSSSTAPPPTSLPSVPTTLPPPVDINANPFAAMMMQQMKQMANIQPEQLQMMQAMMTTMMAANAAAGVGAVGGNVMAGGVASNPRTNMMGTMGMMQAPAVTGTGATSPGVMGMMQPPVPGVVNPTQPAAASASASAPAGMRMMQQAAQVVPPRGQTAAQESSSSSSSYAPSAQIQTSASGADHMASTNNSTRNIPPDRSDRSRETTTGAPDRDRRDDRRPRQNSRGRDKKRHNSRRRSRSRGRRR
ncbi:unnamed protein product [Amoebophrya sp. A25]|nr:unnamed protein product [Amoebophrya sp. A25]|eukprot:GSA25T00005022001.1